ncbi:MAG: PDZ domain-containing protein, partial [Planctomycetes bacterium]|nr:PDZ domain-containing protein [Planctomycetota bacterium]
TDDFGVQVEFIEPALRSQLNLADDVGVLVKNVEENSAGVRIGLKQWDVVLEINGESVKTIWEFRRLLKEALKQKKLEIQIIRQGEKHLLKYGE